MAPARHAARFVWSPIVISGLLAACAPQPPRPPTERAVASAAEPTPSATPPTPSTPPGAASSEDAGGVSSPEPTKPPAPGIVSDVAWTCPDASGQGCSLVVVHADRVRLIDPTTGTGPTLTPGGGAISLLAVHAARGTAPALLSLKAGADEVSLWRTDGTLVTRFPWTSTKGVQAIALSKDARRAAVLREDRVVVGPTDGAAGSTPIADFATDGPAFDVALHDDDRHLLIASSSLVTVFDLQKGARVGDPHSIDTGGTFPTVLSPDGRWVAASTAAGHTLTVWQAVPFRQRATLGTAPDCSNHVSCVFSSDGRSLYGAAGQAWNKTFVAGTWRVRHAANPGKGARVTYTSLSENGQIGLRGEAPKVELFDVATKGIVGSLDVGPEQSVRLSPDGKWIARFGSAGFALFETRGLHPVAVSPPK